MQFISKQNNRNVKLYTVYNNNRLKKITNEKTTYKVHGYFSPCLPKHRRLMITFPIPFF